MNLKKLFAILIIAVILASCAKPNDPVSTSEVLKIEKEFLTGGYAMDFAVSDEIVFVAEDQRGFSIYNYISGTQLCHRDTLQGQYLQDTRHLAGSRLANLTFVFDAVDADRLLVYDISDQLNPVYKTHISGRTENIEKVLLHDNPDGTVNLYWTSNNNFKTGYFDDQWAPEEYFIFPDDVSGFDLNDEIYIVAAQQYGLYILEDSGEEIMTLLNIIDTSGEVLDVKIVDNYVIAAIREEGFAIYDITDYSDPVQVFTENTSEIIYTVDVENEHLILSSHSGGIILYDISNISEPKLMGKIDDSVIGYTFKAEIHNKSCY